MRCYEALLDGYYPTDRALLAINPAWMRYAGPKEAVFHALIRRNYGCTHFIVGRDHAGVSEYYDTYMPPRGSSTTTRPANSASRSSDVSTPYGAPREARWCRAGRPHPADRHLTLSGTRVREMLQRGEDLPVEFTRPEVASHPAAAAAEAEVALVR